MGGCQNDGPFLGTLNIRCRTIIGTQTGTIILTTTHINLALLANIFRKPLLRGANDHTFDVAIPWI